MALIEKMHFDKPPIMMAAWPGMGNVGLMAVDYLRKHLDATMFAEVDMAPFYIPEAVVVENGMARFPEIPRSVFHEQHDPNLVFFESEASVGGKDGITILNGILNVARKLSAPRIFTAAAFAQPMSYTSESRVYSACNTQRLRDELDLHGIEPMPSGQISGLNGLLLGIAASQDVEAACFLATIPSYATALSYPKASLEIVKSISSIINISVNLDELEHQVHESEQQLGQIEERISGFFEEFTQQHQEEPEFAAQTPPETQEKKPRVPEHAMEKIEQLFARVRKDRSRAQELKEELDKWDLYALYEDRFLNLFRSTQESESEEEQ
ncbi:MAG: PAC2 family protein [Chitinivibrionales bacterium]